MKISKIKKDGGIYIVSFTPNWFEKIFNVKPKRKEYKSTGAYYSFGGGRVYVDKKGRKLGPDSLIGKKIDNFRNSF